MPDENLYEYAIIRIFPKVEREEFINAGVLIYSKAKKKLLVKTYFNKQKYSLYRSDLEEEQILLNLKSFELIACGSKKGGPIAQMDLSSRFRWMTAVRSSCLQTARPHPGFSDDLKSTLNRLFEEMVM